MHKPSSHNSSPLLVHCNSRGVTLAVPCVTATAIPTSTLPSLALLAAPEPAEMYADTCSVSPVYTLHTLRQLQ
jgi:hypothetical protein